MMQVLSDKTAKNRYKLKENWNCCRILQVVLVVVSPRNREDRDAPQTIPKGVVHVNDLINCDHTIVILVIKLNSTLVMLFDY